MKYFPYNKEVELQIKAIKKTIRLSMNGVSADAMKIAGLNYVQNFGLSIPRIKEIASKYEPNTFLAQQLWELKIRETMILATLLHPKDTFNSNLCDAWIRDVNTIELCQQSSYNLFQYLPYINKHCIEWISSNRAYFQITGFLVASRIYAKFSDSERKLIFEKIESLSQTNDFQLYHALSICLRYFCRANRESLNRIQLLIAKFKESANKSQQYIFEEVKMEIDFLN